MDTPTGDAADLVHHYDHAAISVMEDPFGLIADARRRCPVAHSDQYGGFWVLFSYEDIGDVARDPQTFSSNKGLGIPDHGFPVRLPPIEIDPPQHIQFRGPLLDRFSPGSVAELEPQIRSVVTTLIDGFIETGRVDLAADLTIPLPNIVIPHLFDIPVEDGQKFHDWSTRNLRVEKDDDSNIEMFLYFMDVCDDRIAHARDPKVDLVSHLLGLTIDDRPITREEVVCTMCTLVSAGVDTTAVAGAHMLLILGKRPDLRQVLRDDPSRIPIAIEELLRFVTPVSFEIRVTLKDTEIRGVPIPEGERVSVNWIAANHDPEEFPEPDEIRLDRDPNRHFAFGAGPHRCIGAHLARLELRILLEEALRRLPDYQIIEEGVVRYTGITRGISHVPATFSPGSRQSNDRLTPAGLQAESGGR